MTNAELIDALNRLDELRIWIDPNGYEKVKLDGHPRASKRDHLVFRHVLIAEKVLGRFLEREHQIHHFDRNTSNNANANLVICESRAYHALLHVRHRVFDAGGDPETQKFCNGVCGLLKSKTEFHRNRSLPDGLHGECIPCSLDRHKTYYQRNRTRIIQKLHHTRARLEAA